MKAFKELRNDMAGMSKDEKQLLLIEVRQSGIDNFFGEHKAGPKLLRILVWILKFFATVSVIKPSYKFFVMILLEWAYGVAERNNIEIQK